MTFTEFLRYILLLIFFPRSLKTMEWRMLRLLNKDRKMYKLPPLRMQEDLRQVARKHSQDMARKDYFEHVNLEGKSPSDRLKIARVTDVTTGENLAKIGGYRHATQFAETGLMNSPGHKANILHKDYNAVGIGVIQDLRRIYYFTQNFARRIVIFSSKVPSSVTLRRGVHIRGIVFTHAKALLYQIHLPGIQEPMEQRLFPLSGQRFDVHVSFPDIGRYEVWLFADQEGNGYYQLCNIFEVKCRKGFLF